MSRRSEGLLRRGCSPEEHRIMSLMLALLYALQGDDSDLSKCSRIISDPLIMAKTTADDKSSASSSSASGSSSDGSSSSSSSGSESRHVSTPTPDEVTIYSNASMRGK